MGIKFRFTGDKDKIKFKLPPVKLVQGPRGYGVTGVERVSGDHSPGTNDIYRLNFENGGGDSFTVYNGRDGETGPPGLINFVFLEGDPDEAPTATYDLETQTLTMKLPRPMTFVTHSEWERMMEEGTVDPNTWYAVGVT